MMKDKNKKSLRQKSMKMVVSIIKLSSFSIAKMSLGAVGSPTGTKSFAAATASPSVTDETLLLPQFAGGQRSETPQSSSKPISFLMQPAGGGDESSYAIHKEEGENDGKFAEYIRKVHAKNRSHLQEASQLSPYILPPPPLTMK